MAAARRSKSEAERLGYARVSTASQNLDGQRDALGEAGCGRIFEDTISGTAKERPGWDALLSYARTGDTLVVCELSRMSRSLLHLLQVVAELEERGIGIVSLRESIDTTTATGRLFLSIMGAVSQMERELRAERAATGRAAARARGRSGGRPRTPRDQLEKARRLYTSQEMTAAEAAAAVGISRRRLFGYLAETREANKTAPSKSPSPKPPDGDPAREPVQLARFGGEGRYRWRHYTVESTSTYWTVREHRDETGQPLRVEGNPRSLFKSHGPGRLVARVRTLDDARRLLAGETVTRAFAAEGMTPNGAARLAKIALAGSGSAATYGWKHLVAWKSASGLWTIEALWTPDGEPADAVLTATRKRHGVGEEPHHERLESVATLRKVRERLPRLAEQSLRDHDQRRVRLRDRAA